MNNFKKKIISLIVTAANVFTFCTSAAPDISNAQEENQISFRPSAICANLQQSSSYIPKKSAEFPEKFDLRDYGLISSVKHQFYNTCWAHSSASCAETNFIKYNPSIDLSELHTAYYSWAGGDQLESITENNDIKSILDIGGTCYNVTNLWSQWLGPTFEKNMPYSASDLDILYDEKSIEACKNLSDYHLENVYFIDYNNSVSREESFSSVKSYLQSGKSVEASIYTGTSDRLPSEYYLSKDKTAFYTGKQKTSDHSITIIGWDDNYSADNFNGRAKPKHNGAWIVKNSWGTSSGESGFIYISYEEPSLADFAVYELGSKDNYDTNYHHDTFYPSQYITAGSTDTTYMANVFTAEKNQYIEAVSTYFVIPDIEYEINIYKDIYDEERLSAGKTYLTQKGKADKAGYITIPLDKPVKIVKGQKFAISVKLHSNSTNYLIPVESSTSFVNKSTGESNLFESYLSVSQLEANTSEKQSFFSNNGIKWTDTTSVDFTYPDEEKYAAIEMTEELYGTEKADTYRQYAKNSDLVVTLGNISLKVFASDENKVKFSHSEKNVPLNEAVTLSSPSGKDIYYSLNGSTLHKYTAPISITSSSTISATVDQKTFYTKTFEPAKAELNSLSCFINGNEIEAQRIDSSNYRIFISDRDSASFSLLTSSQGEISLNGTPLKEYEYNSNPPLSIDSNMMMFTIKAQQENRLDNEISVSVFLPSKKPYYGDIDGDSSIDASDASAILRIYVLQSTHSTLDVTADEYKRADFNQDGIVDATDASDVLYYYAVMATS